MGQYARPIFGTTAAGTGATYVILNRYTENTRIQTSVNGTVSDYDVDFTIDNITANAGLLASAQFQYGGVGDRVLPASATWIATDLNAESAAGALDITTPVFALRILINAGTGSVTYRILQTG